MHDYDIAAATIIDALANSGEKGVVLYCAVPATQNIIKALAVHDVSPLCICDRNEALWHTRWSGVEIIPIDEAKSRFGDFLIFILNGRRQYEIIGQLLTDGIATKEQIVNYVPVEKKVSCIWINNGLLLFDDNLYFCCTSFGRKMSTFVQFSGNYDETIDAFIAMREKTIRELNEGISNPCSDCVGLVESYWPKDQANIKISNINYSNGGVCNSRCVYCNAPAKTNKTAAMKIDLSKLVAALQARDKLDLHSVCQFASGEITIAPNRSELYSIMKLFCQNNILTNAIIHDENISEILSENRGAIWVSVDAGTKETFAMIKGMCAFDSVCNTLRRYSQNSQNAIYLKYILLPGINDNKKDIDGFIALAKEVKAFRVIISSDSRHPELIDDNIIAMAEYFKDRLQESAISCETNSDIIGNRTNIRNTY